MANIQVGYGHSDVLAEPFDYAAPLTTNVITMQTAKLVVNPAGTIAALTVNFPLNPPDGTVVEISTTQIITALTLVPGTGDVIVNGVLGAVTGITPVATVGAGSATNTIKYKYTLFGTAGANAPVGAVTANARTYIRVQ